MSHQPGTFITAHYWLIPGRINTREATLGSFASDYSPVDACGKHQNSANSPLGVGATSNRPEAAMPGYFAQVHAYVKKSMQCILFYLSIFIFIFLLAS